MPDRREGQQQVRTTNVPPPPPQPPVPPPPASGAHMTDPSKLPPSPITALAEGAAQWHEVYEACVAAGFDRQQAMQIICAMITANLRGGA